MGLNSAFKGLIRDRKHTENKVRMLYLERDNDLTFKSLAFSLRTTRFNIKKFYMVLASR